MFSFSRNSSLSCLGVVSILSIVALLSFQVYWLYNSYKTTYNNFVEKAQEALREACAENQKLTEQETEKTISRKYTKSEYLNENEMDSIRFVVFHSQKTSHSTKLDRLDSLFRIELSKRNLHVNYALEIAGYDEPLQTKGMRSQRSEIVVSSSDNPNHVISMNIDLQSGDAVAEQGLTLSISTERVTAYIEFTPFLIFRQMTWILIVSTLLFIIILYCFLSQLRVIRRQKTTAKMKNDFIANFTHELKTPIAVAYAALDAIERNPEQYETAVKMGKLQLEHLSDSVEKILSLSVEEHSRLTLHREETALYEWLESLLIPFRLKTEKEAVFELLCEPIGIKATIDKIHLSHAINNIIDNAIKYSGDSVHILISCDCSQERLRISVQDNGFGIDEEDLKKIFQRFYRAATASEKVKGFGLGLNYAKEIVELHGGSIAVKSKRGEGSTFIIDLPV